MLTAVAAYVLAMTSIPAFAGQGEAPGQQKGTSTVESTLSVSCDPCVVGAPVDFFGTGYDPDLVEAVLDIAGVAGVVGVVADGSISFSWTFDRAGEHTVAVYQQKNRKRLALEATAVVVVISETADITEPPPADEPVNEPPIAVDDVATTDGESITIDVAANDSDPDGNLDSSSVTVSCESCAPPTSGSATVESTLVVYTPAPDVPGTDTFEYEICDLDGLCVTAGVSVTVTAAITADPVVRDGEGLVRVAVNAKSRFDPYTKDPSISQQETMRSLYDLMIVRAPYFDSRLAWFPNAIAYIDLYAIYSDPHRDTRAQTNPEWILRDRSGNPLYIDWGCSGGTCPQYAGDIGNPAFRSDFLQQISQLIQTGYAGVMIDDVNMSWRISNGNGDRVIPIDPRTGREMTLSDWRRYVAELTELVRSEFPNIDIMHNAIWYADSPNFSDPYINRQIAAADWIMLERGVNDGGLVGGFDSKWSIHTLFGYVDAIHQQGTGVLYLDETADTFTEQEYNLAAYLLTSNGNDLVSTEDYPVIAPDSIWAGYTTNLGDALGSRYQWNNVTRRDFSGGMVLLADPDTPTQTMTLPTPHTTLDGRTVTTITLTNTTGMILLND